MRLTVLQALATVAFVLAAQPLYAESLMDDLVETRDDKFIISEYSLCKVKRPGNDVGPKFQLETYSEAPDSDVISRDNFVAYTVSTLTLLRAAFAQRWGLPASEAFSALDCDPLAEPIGTVDLKIKIFMTSEGVQIEITDTSTGRVSRTTDSWDD